MKIKLLLLLAQSIGAGALFGIWQHNLAAGEFASIIIFYWLAGNE